MLAALLCAACTSDAGNLERGTAPQDKRFAELKSTSDEIKNKMKINDFLSLQTLFEKLNKQLEKTLRVSEGPCFALSQLRFPRSY